MPGDAEDSDGFGERLVARDLDGDGFSDLAVFSSGEDLSASGGGVVTVLWGRAGGLSGAGAAIIKAPTGFTGSDLSGGDF
ncbi:hypothetical protein [Streptomyces sp. 1222.5]|uniref:hypothetical protein n=1 Tax=Streptomyces sp. 1222.5 TaxID=1881026 RepID=UPI003EBA30E7